MYLFTLLSASDRASLALTHLLSALPSRWIYESRRVLSKLCSYIMVLLKHSYLRGPQTLFTQDIFWKHSIMTHKERMNGGSPYLVYLVTDFTEIKKQKCRRDNQTLPHRSPKKTALFNIELNQAQSWRLSIWEVAQHSGTSCFFFSDVIFWRTLNVFQLHRGF